MTKVATVYAESFNEVEEERVWDKESAKLYMMHWFKKQPDLFLVAEHGNEIAGVVVGEIAPGPNGKMLTEVELCVSNKFRKQGIAKSLLSKIILDSQEKYQIVEVSFLAKSSAQYPIGWYKKIGMKDSPWVFMSGDSRIVLNNLKNDS